MTGGGRFVGIGVGSGAPGLISLAAREWLRRSDVIYAPRARGAGASMALRCLEGVEFDRTRVRETEFAMEDDRGVARERYDTLAAEICALVDAGRTVAYLTLGDPMTYSTYAYAVAAVRRRCPTTAVAIVPGITSFCAAAAAAHWPLALGRERVLLVPCPDDMAELRAEIETHDVVVVMKIGHRYGAVVELLRAMGILEHCAYARRVGFPEGRIVPSLREPPAAAPGEGYLSVFLIRKGPAPDAGAG